MRFCFIIVTFWWRFSVVASTALLADKIRESEAVHHHHDPNKDKELFEKLKNVHSHWYVGAVRGLLGAVGNEIYRELPPVFQQELTACLGDIVDEDDLTAGAQCVSKAFDMEERAKSGVHWIGGLGMKPEKESDSLKAGHQKPTAEQKSTNLHWKGSFGTVDGDADQDTSLHRSASNAVPKNPLWPPSVQLLPDANHKLNKPGSKFDQIHFKKNEHNIISHQPANGAGLMNGQVWDDAFGEVKHASNIEFAMKANADGSARIGMAKDWPKSISNTGKIYSSQINIYEEITDRSGITKVIGYPSARFAQENAAAENDYLRNKVARDNVASLLEQSDIVESRPVPRTRFQFSVRKRLLPNRNVSAHNGAQKHPVNSGTESEEYKRQQVITRMNSVKRLLKSKTDDPNALQNEVEQLNHQKKLEAIQKANEQMWLDLINEWKAQEEQKKERTRNWMKLGSSSATSQQRNTAQSETVPFDNHPQQFLNHPRRLNTGNVVVRADRNGQVLGNINRATQHFSSLNLNEQTNKQQTNDESESASPLNWLLERIFDNGETTDQDTTAAIRSDGWTGTRSRQRRNFRIDDVDADFDDVKVRYLDKMPSLSEYQAYTPTESPLTKISKIMTGMVRGEPAFGRDVTSWKSSYKRLWRLKEQLKSWKDTQQRSQANQQRRLLDMVTGNFKGSDANVPDNNIPDANGFHGIGDIPLASEVTELVNFLTQHNVSKSVKFLSPRLAPLLPRNEKAPGGNLLSPSLLAFYSDSSPNNIAPLPEVLGAAGMSEEEKDAFLEFVMELTGARDIVDKIFENLDSPEGLGGLRQDILDANDQLTNVWTQFQSSYSDRQKDDIDTKGYAFLDSEQLDLFYGNDGYYNYTKPELNLDSYYQLSDEERRASLRATVRKLAGETPTEAAMRTWDRRLQQNVLKPSVGAYGVLAPFTFGPSILSPAVLGPIVLSPNIFSPGILSPYLLSPPILSPSVGDPLILSPYVLGPNILSPSVLTPYVLSPYVLSPNILNPYVLSPLILSPYLLSPDILSPTVLSGTILSPYVLSPAILSDSVLAASVLSPSILSKK